MQMVELVQFREAVQFFQIMFAGHFKKFVRVDASFHDSIVPHNRHTMQNDP
jgi:hypothetical protein